MDFDTVETNDLLESTLWTQMVTNIGKLEPGGRELKITINDEDRVFFKGTLTPLSKMLKDRIQRFVRHTMGGDYIFRRGGPDVLFVRLRASQQDEAEVQPQRSKKSRRKTIPHVP